MIQSEHISRDDLLELLNSETESDKTRNIGQHLHQCESCRQALDALTARSEVWKKTPELLKASQEISDVANLKSHELDTTDQQPHESASSGWEFPLDGILDPPKHPEMIGRIGKYDIEREVGRGGMGVVFKAHDSELNRPLAIKVLSPHLASHGTARKRFAQEARAAAGVLHPNVIAVYDVNNDGKTPYIVMPYVAGPSLQRLVDQNGPLAEIEIVRVALQIAAGLIPAHSQGLVHRDIKPANILVEQGVNRVIITDFGLARAEDDASLTRTGWLTGTPNYMSPEQARGERLDHRSDLFSLGSLIYFLATGHLPFRAESPLGVLTRIQNDTPTPVRQVNNQISKTLSDVIDALLKKNPEHRFQSAGQLHDLLERHLAYLHQPDISKPPKVLPNTAAKKSWKPVAFNILFLSIALLLLGYFGFFGGPNIPNTLTKNDASSQPGTLIVPNGEQEQEKNSEDETDENQDSDDSEIRFQFSFGNFSQSNEGRQLFKEGYKLLQNKKFNDALRKFEQSAKFNGYQSKSNYNIGCVWALKKDKDKAFAALNKAVDLGFIDLQQYQNDNDLASLRSDKRFKDLVKRIIKLSHVEQLVSSADARKNEQDYTEMESLCRKALELNPKHEKAVVNLGYALHMQGKLQEAVQWHQKAARSKKYSAIGNYNLCCIHAINKETDKAFLYLDKALDAGLAQFIGSSHFKHDGDLNNIRSDKRYKLAVEEINLQQGGLSGSYFYIRAGDADVVSISPTALNDEKLKGKWTCYFVQGHVHLTVTQSKSDEDLKWGYSSRFKTTDFKPELTKSSTEFRLEREFGTLVFKGSFTGRRGKGEFEFDGEDKFKKWLTENDIEAAPQAALYPLFMSWKSEKEIVANLKELQELDIDKKSKMALMAHGVRASLVKQYQQDKLAVDQHLQFIVWRVRSAMIKQYNKADLDLEKHKSFINRRVPASLIVAYNKAKFDLKKHEKFITRRVRPSLLKQYNEAGYSLDDYADYINWRVSPQQLKDYEKAGFDLQENRSFIQYRVPPQLLKDYQAAGYSLKKYKYYIQQRVPAKLLKQYDDAGFSLDKHRVFLRSRIPLKLLEAYQDAGMLTERHKPFILRHVPLDLLKSYQDDRFELQEHKYFIYHRVPTSLLKRYKKAGLDIQKYKSLIQRRMEPEKALKYLKEKKSKD